MSHRVTFFVLVFPIVCVCLFAQGVQMQITPASLPQGQQGNMYGEAFSAAGGTAPYSWSISTGTLPPGITMNGNGNFVGTPTASGTFNFAVSATDANGNITTSNFSVNIAAASGYDGPAQLPIATVGSSMAQTPAPGSVINVNAGGDLGAALNSAQCGDTIQLQAGASFTGTFRFPARNCDSNHWIIVRTSSPDSALPAEGQRLTPCYAGVASLPGRPQYSCSNPQNILAKLVASTVIGPVVFQNGANHYRLVGLELTRPTGTKGAPTLISVDRGGSASYIVVDRSWVHGTTQDDTHQGFALSGTNTVAIVDSYFSDFHCTSLSGACSEAHAVSGGTGNYQDGTYLIQDNFLEASAQAILFGGGPATATPTDISIRFNHFFKPWQWMTGNSPFQGGTSGNPFIVRHHLELKNAVRVLMENNLMENVWGGFSEPGNAILLNPKNQNSKSRDVCPICAVTDVTIRYTHIFHAGGGIVLATALSGHGGAPAQLGTRFSIHDVVMDDISKQYLGLGELFYVANAWPSNPLNTITINHITGFPDPNGGIMSLGNQITNPVMYGFVFTNSIVTTGRYPVWSTGGGSTNCAFSGVPLTSLSTCFSTYTFNNNVLVASPSRYGPSSWPAGSLFTPSPDGVSFVQYANGNGGNYQLQPNSPYRFIGSDGRDLGADMVGLNASLAGVE
jgi:Putative Ig domain